MAINHISTSNVLLLPIVSVLNISQWTLRKELQMMTKELARASIPGGDLVIGNGSSTGTHGLMLNTRLSCIQVQAEQQYLH